MKKMTKTYLAKPGATRANKWYVIDADGKILGRLASKAAMILMGKSRPDYTPNVNLGDHVIVLNSRKVRVKGTNKPKQKIYQRYTGYTGGLKEMTLEKMLEKKPNEVIREAVRKMLPKNLLASTMMRRLRVFEGAEHDHKAQTAEFVQL